MKNYNKLTLLSAGVLFLGIIISASFFVIILEMVGDFGEIEFRPYPAIIFYITAVISIFFSVNILAKKETTNTIRVINILLIVTSIIFSCIYTLVFLIHLF